MGKLLDFRARTASTNDLALEAGRAGAQHGATFVADVQDKGRGRRGREWKSPPGLGLLFSVLTRPAKISASDTGWIPLLAGLACREGVRDTTGLQLALKWPNDIVLPAAKLPGWRKLGGILCESVLPAKDNVTPSAGARSNAYVVIGIGVNVNHTQAELPLHTKAPPSSLRIEKRRAVERTALLGSILEHLENCLLALEAPASTMKLKQRIEDHLREWWTRDTTLRVQPGSEEDGEPIVEGAFGRLDDFGRLVVLDRSGRVLTFADAEIVGVS